ncbi:MAG: DUF4129 domain-containing protein [Flavobacteriales bacterium]|jgi:hypothetical protein
MASKKNKAILLFAFLWVSLAGAQDNPAGDTASIWTPQQWKETTSGLDYTNPDEKEKEKEEKEEENKDQFDNDWDATGFVDWLNDFLTSELGKTVMLFLIIGGLAYVLFRMLTRMPSNKDSKLPADLSYFLEHIDETFQESDMDRMLRLAIDASDLKTAVRILYLRLLRQLHDQSWISWKKDKTNRDFLLEMRGHPGYRTFKNLTLTYEIVWYGDTEIRMEEFDGLNQLFTEYQSTLQPKPDAKQE